MATIGHRNWSHNTRKDANRGGNSRSLPSRASRSRFPSKLFRLMRQLL